MFQLQEQGPLFPSPPFFFCGKKLFTDYPYAATPMQGQPVGAVELFLTTSSVTSESGGNKGEVAGGIGTLEIRLSSTRSSRKYLTAPQFIWLLRVVYCNVTYEYK